MHHAARIAPIVVALGALSPVTAPQLPPEEIPGLDALSQRPLLVASWSEDMPDRVDGMPPDNGPSFVLYEDGTVLHLRRTKDGRLRMESHLSGAEARALVADLVRDGFLEAQPFADAAEATDVVGASIALRIDRSWYTAVVAGILPDGTAAKRGEKPAPGFVAALRRLSSFDAASAVPFRPRQLRVSFVDPTFYPVSMIPSADAPWPSALAQPTLEAKWGRGTAIYDVERLALLTSLAAPRSTVTIDGRRWMFGLWSAFPEEAYLDRVREAAMRAPRS